MADTDTPHTPLGWWRQRVTGGVDHDDVIARVHDDAGWTARYLFMLAMSAGIAVLGLLLSSPAVVIGAMLISPLMGPILGLGFALATADAGQIRRAGFALVAGAVLAVAFCAALVLMSPLQNVTPEIAARTRPNLFDLLVALFSALAGSYAVIHGRAGTIVGVAIATALMPPLATVGFGLATGNWTVFGGALLLFVTNFVTIALTAAVMARLYGFGPRLSPHQTAVQSVAIIATLAVLAVPLALSLRRIAWEGAAGRYAREALTDTFGDQARISQVELDFHARPIKVTATVLTPRYRADAEGAAGAAFLADAGQRATFAIEQYRVGTGPGAAEAAAIQTAAANTAAATTAKPVTDADAQAHDFAARLALVAGVDPGQVLVDAAARRLRATAAVLPGATLAAYHLLEMRAAAGATGWSVELVPPAVPLPGIDFDGAAPSAAGRADLAQTIWGARRLGLSVAVAGPAARAQAVVAALTTGGVTASHVGGGRTVALRWAVPAPVAPALTDTPLTVTTTVTPAATPSPAPRQ